MEDHLVQEAYRYCEWMTSHHYENFPVASRLLPKGKRPAVAAIYAFARSADDFADEAKYQGRSLELLSQWRKALWACGDRHDGGVAHPIFLALADAIHRCNLPVQLCDDLLTAFTMDVTKRRYADWQELMDYCRYSANPVGRLVLTIFGYQDPRLYQLSDSICTGLQLANHWQDLSIDLAKDLVYVPETVLRSHGVTVEELKALRGKTSLVEKPSTRCLTPSVLSLIKELVERSRGLFDQGEPLVSSVSGRLRLELKLTLLGGRAILDRIAQVNCDVFRHRPVLSAWDKLKLLTHAVLS